MRNIFIHTGFIFFAVMQLLACRKDDIDPPLDRTSIPRTIGQFIQNNYNFSLLKTALVKTGLMDSLNAPNAGTFFAPDNHAFNISGIFDAAAFDRMNVDSLRMELLSYMLPQRYFVAEFPAQMGNALQTKSGRTMYLSVSPAVAYNGPEHTEFTINGVPVSNTLGINRNVGLVNGVVHVPMRLMKFRDGTVQDLLAANSNLSIFTEAMKRFNFWEGLKNNNPITVFAPSNEAFERLGITLDSVSRMGSDQFDPIVFGFYHFNLSPKRIFTSDGWLIGGTLYREQGIRVGAYSFVPNYNYSYYNKEENWEIVITKEVGSGSWQENTEGPAYSTYDGGAMPSADYLTKNGVVHIINDVLLLPGFFKK